MALWSFFYFIWLKTPERAPAEFFLRTCMIPVVFMPSSFFRFVTALTHKRVPRWVHSFNYVASASLALTVYSTLFAIGGAPPHLVFPYWPKPGVLFPIHLIHFFIIVGAAHIILLQTGLRPEHRKPAGDGKESCSNMRAARDPGIGTRQPAASRVSIFCQKYQRSPSFQSRP